MRAARKIKAVVGYTHNDKEIIKTLRLVRGFATKYVWVNENGREMGPGSGSDSVQSAMRLAEACWLIM
jgi:hypothetical protein